MRGDPVQLILFICPAASSLVLFSAQHHLVRFLAKTSLMFSWGLEPSILTGLNCFIEEHNVSMVFPVVMYGCESWTIVKAEH